MAATATFNSLATVKLKYEVNIDGRIIKPVHSIVIQQRYGEHYQLDLVFPHETVQEEGTFVLDDAQHILGRLVEVRILDSGDPSAKGLENKFISTRVGLVQEGLNEGMLQVTALSPTWILDGAAQFESFYQSSLAEIAGIIAKPMESLRTKIKVNTSFNDTLAYTCRYGESGWAFLKRLSGETGQWLFFNGKDLAFGLPGKGETKAMVYGQTCLKMNMQVTASPVQTGIFDYNAETNSPIQYPANTYTGHPGSSAESVFGRSGQLFNVAPTYSPNSSLKGESAVEQLGKARAASQATVAYKITGTSTVYSLNIGDLVDISFKRLGKSGGHRQMRITAVKHELTNGNIYINEFEAVPSSAEMPPPIAFDRPVTYPMLARVLSNADPEGQGRVQVQFLGWVQNHATQQTDWIRISSPNAGSSKAVSTNRGFIFVPEVDDQVLVDFENGNPDKPFVAHNLYHGGNAAGGGPKNHIKSITTRSGTVIQFDDNDSQGSITIKDPSGNIVYLDGNGNADYTSPQKITFNATNIEINAANNIMLNAGNNVIINAVNRLNTYASYAKQTVTNALQFFSAKALISSLNSINIESSEVNAIGSDKLFLHSDTLLHANSKGDMDLKSNGALNSTQNAKDAVTTPPEQIGLAIVEFRPLSTYMGEFGFDWMRIDDSPVSNPANSPGSCLPYKDTIVTGYAGGQLNPTTHYYNEYTQPHAYEHLKSKYKNIPVNRPAAANASTPANTQPYYVPWLNLYPKAVSNAAVTTSATSAAVPLPQPPFEATLTVLVEIFEDLDKLEFVYDKTELTLDQNILADKAPCGKMVSASGTIKITCAGTNAKSHGFNQDKEIKVYAYPKNSTGINDRKLAGKLIVCKNDAANRRHLNVVLIPIKTQISGSKLNTGIFSNDDKQNMMTAMHQALINPQIEDYPGAFDLTNDNNFKITTDIHGNKTSGKFIFENKANNPQQTMGGIFEDYPGELLFTYLRDTFLKLPHNSKYSNYFVVFAFGEDAYDTNYTGGGGWSATLGQTKHIGQHNVVLFKKKTSDPFTLAHESLHGLGLHHSFDAGGHIEDTGQQFIFQQKMTDNIMDYSTTKRSTWHWQWQIMIKNLPGTLPPAHQLQTHHSQPHHA